MLADLDGKGLVVHHWDTDGICSACLLLDHLSDTQIVNKTLEIGNYFLTGKNVREFTKFDYIIIADISLPIRDVQALADDTRVIIFDHHVGPLIEGVDHHNPVIQGDDPDEYPSTSWIINQYLGNENYLYAFLGVIGDHEHDITKNSKLYNVFLKFCGDLDLRIEDFIRMTHLLDSNYKVGNKGGVEEAPRYLLKNNDIPHAIFANETWRNQALLLTAELDKWTASPGTEADGIILHEIDTRYNIISSITRRIFRDTRKDVLVVNTGFYPDKDQVYMRSTTNLGDVINWAKNKGFNCGGKNEVFGAIIPKHKTECFVAELLDLYHNRK